MNKVLVTGAAGFIGMNLIRKLSKNGYTIVGIDNINAYYDVNLKYDRLLNIGIEKDAIRYNSLVVSSVSPNFKFVKLDLTDRLLIFRLFDKEQFDFVINLAAEVGVRNSVDNPDSYIQSNVLGFHNVIEASKSNNIKHFIYASSSSVYGLNEKVPFSTSDSTEEPMSIYAATKKSNELIAHTYSHLFKLPTTGLRFFTVYGPWGRPDMAIYLMTKAIVEGTPIKVFNNGQMVRDFTYIDDIVEGILKVLKNIPKIQLSENTTNFIPKPPYKLYNLACGLPVSLMDFIGTIEGTLGKKAVINLLPMQAGDMSSTLSDITNSIQELQYVPTTNIDVGVKNFVKWYIAYNYDRVDSKLSQPILNSSNECFRTNG